METIMALHRQQRRVTAELEHQRISSVLESSIILNAVPWNHPSRHVPTHQFMRNVEDHFILNDINLNHHISERRNLQQQQQQQQQHFSFEKVRIDGGSDPTTCPICLEDFCTESEAIRLPNLCGHTYHQDCIMEWLKRSNTCPMCRRTVM